MADGAIEIVVRAITHDGRRMLGSIVDTNDELVKLYGREARNDAASVDEDYLSQLRTVERAVSHTISLIRNLRQAFELGQASNTITDYIQNSLVVTAAQIAEIGKRISQRHPIQETDGHALSERFLAESSELLHFFQYAHRLAERLSTTRIERVRLETELSRAIRDISHRHPGIDWARTGTNLTHSLIVSRGAIYLLFKELVSNSFKYRHPDHPIRIRAEDREDEGQIQIEFEDNGIGIPSEDCARAIFEFGQRSDNAVRLDSSRQGNSHSQGMGLAIVRLITDYLGATVVAKSTVGKGATFVIRLPAGSGGEK